ncbi:MAG: substrate-binding domain-containing protein [Desulfobacula sp.]|nr:substrate-binding domain-containing protein [Desulfobacula sp.]
MKKAIGMAGVVVVSLWVLWAIVPPAMATAGQGLQYSCSAQVYEAFEGARLKAFTKETGIPIDLFVASSHSCVYRVMQDMSDIASSTRAIYQRHKDHGLLEIPFCKDPLTIITHKAISVDNLSSEQLRQIFSGGITNWKEVGGADVPMIIVVPGNDTGAYKNFMRQVMKHKEIKYDYLTYKSTRVLEAIEGLPAGAISFISRGAQINHLKIKALTIDGKKPGDTNYPYYQIFYLVSKGEPKGSIKAFADFITSEKGRSIILERGMLPIN